MPVASQTPQPEASRLAQELYRLLRDLDRTPAPRERPLLAERARRLSERLHVFTMRSAPSHGPHLALVSRKLQRSTLGLWRRSAEGRAFADFRARAAPLYEEFAAQLRACRLEAPTLRPANHARSLMHIGSGLLSLVCVESLSRSGSILLAAFVAFVATGLELMRRRSEWWRKFAMALFGKVAHAHEAHRVGSASWYALALLVLSVACPQPASAAACVVLGLADPAAAYVGRRFGRTRLRAGRSLEGSLAFFVVGSLAAYAVFMRFHGSLDMPWPRIAIVAGLFGALAELWSGRVDDNLSVPLAVGASVTGALALAP